MSSGTVPHLTGTTILDPTLARWRRRYFHQPVDGPARRAFTAARAERGRLVPGRATRLIVWWQVACEVETATRNRTVWP